MKNTEIRELSLEALTEKLASSEQELKGLKFSHAVAPIENPLEIRRLRREVAQLKTELHARTVATVQESVNSGALTLDNAREYLQSTKFPSSIKLVKLKQIISKSAN